MNIYNEEEVEMSTQAQWCASHLEHNKREHALHNCKRWKSSNREVGELVVSVTLTHDCLPGFCHFREEIGVLLHASLRWFDRNSFADVT